MRLLKPVPQHLHQKSDPANSCYIGLWFIHESSPSYWTQYTFHTRPGIFLLFHGGGRLELQGAFAICFSAAGCIQCHFSGGCETSLHNAVVCE